MDSSHSQKDRATAACHLVIQFQPSPDVPKTLHDDEFERDGELFVAVSSQEKQLGVRECLKEVTKSPA